MDAALPAPITPLPYERAFEVPEEDEAETSAGLLPALQGSSTTAYADSGHATCSVHAKSHGLLRPKRRLRPGSDQLV